MLIEVNLPSVFTAPDYHDLIEIQRSIRMLNTNLYVKEIGMNAGRYVGVIYFGQITDEVNAKFIEQIKAENGLKD